MNHDTAPQTDAHADPRAAPDGPGADRLREVPRQPQMPSGGSLMRDVPVQAYRPGRLPALWWLRTATYYVHVGLATLVLGLWGLPKARRHGRIGALRVSQVWIDYMLRAARCAPHVGCAPPLDGAGAPSPTWMIKDPPKALKHL